MINKYSQIIWDWNGTLLNDVDWCLKTVNKMLVKRQLKTLEDVKAYHGVFCFPISDYYRKVGFDFEKEPFDILAKEYMTIYLADNTGGCNLYPYAKDTLEYCKNKQIAQVILSASEINILREQVKFLGIETYFSEILGISDIYARSKVELGKEYLQRTKSEKTALIGDSTHDYEVAQALNVDCILIANGHQSKEMLMTCGVPVLSDIQEIMEVI